MEMTIAEMRKELQQKDEKLAAALEEKSRRQEIMQQWLFAVGELETVHGELKSLEDQVAYMRFHSLFHSEDWESYSTKYKSNNKNNKRNITVSTKVSSMCKHNKQ